MQGLTSSRERVKSATLNNTWWIVLWLELISIKFTLICLYLLEAKIKATRSSLNGYQSTNERHVLVAERIHFLNESCIPSEALLLLDLSAAAAESSSSGSGNRVQSFPSCPARLNKCCCCRFTNPALPYGFKTYKPNRKSTSGFSLAIKFSQIYLLI